MILRLFVIILAAVVGPVAAARDGVTVLGSGFSGRPYVLTGDIVLETDGLYEAIRDYDDPDAAEWLGWHAHDDLGRWRDVLVSGSLAVALRDDAGGGFDVVQVSDPARPVITAEITGIAIGSAWLRGRTLVASLGGVLAVYDLADPADPVVRGYLPVPAAGPHRFAAVGDTLYCADGSAGLARLRVADGGMPELLDVVPLPVGGVLALSGRAGHLDLVAAGADPADLALVTFDVDAAGGPGETARTPLGRTTGRAVVVASDDEMLLAAAAGGLHAFALDAPDRPRPLWTTARAVDHLAPGERWIHAAAGDTLLVLARDPDASAPDFVVERPALPRLATVAGDGPVHLAQDYEIRNLIYPVEATDPTRPRLLAPLDAGFAGRLVVGDRLGAVVDAEGRVQVLGLEDRRRPVRMGATQLTIGTVLAAELGGTVLVLQSLDESTGVLALHFIDLGDPSLPAPVAQLEREDASRPLELRDGVMIGRRGTQVAVYDVADPAQPRSVGAIGFERAVVDAALGPETVYAATSDGALHIVGLSDPAAPVVLGSLPPGEVLGDLEYRDGRLYVLGFETGHVVDVTDPAQPVVLAAFPTFYGDAGGGGFAANGPVLTVSGNLATILDETRPPPPPPATGSVAVFAGAHPNPSSGRVAVRVAALRPVRLTVSVHDLRGRRVAVLATGDFETGTSILEWDGIAGGSGRAASGVYLLRLAGPNAADATRITLIR